jgi:hypothetical protein
MADSFNTAGAWPDGMGSMEQTPDLAAAENFLAASGRVLDQRRFELLQHGGDGSAVLAAVTAYRNADGGFGHAIEPDCRCPDSQPAAVEMALRILDEADAWDSGLEQGACDWLALHAAAGGGATFVEAGLESWPHAPWWVPVDGRPASPIQTGMLAATLHARAVAHPWLDRATEVMWELIAGLTAPGPYRERARKAFEQVGTVLLDGKLVELDPAALGEAERHGPLEFAPRPDSLGRQLFDAATIDAHLDHLAGSQQEDGGWMFNWLAWSPAAAADWRGHLTVEAIGTLRANGRL